MKHSILRYGETVIKDGIASQIEIDGVAAQSGNLILTDSRLLLVPHKIKRNSSYLEIPLGRIAKSDDTFCVFCETPNVVEIRTIDGNRFQFAVKKGQKTAWEQNINTATITYFENHPFEKTGPEPIPEPTEEADKEQETEMKAEEVPAQDSAPPHAEPPPSYTVPAPMPPQVNNILIWLVAFAPVIGLFFEFGFWLFLLIAMGFCYWDESNLRRQGYDTFQLGYACIIPAYLYKRARLCNTSKSNLIIWCLMFLVGAFFTFVPLETLIDFLNAIKTANEMIQ